MLIFMLLMATGTLSGDQANQASALDVFMAEGRTQAVYKADLITDDRTFMRRIWLDLAGRLPERERVEKFLASGKRNKRFMEIDFLLASELFTERWTTFFADIFQNFAIFQQYAIYRNAFHDSLRDMVAQNMPWDEMARRIITGSGTGESPDTAMFFWTREAVEESFRLDYLDDQAAWITETMLGVQTLCISCHDGAGHLEQVNLDLTAKKREQFWGMAAFLASTYHYYPEINDDGLDEDEATQLLLRKLQLVDLDEPGYSGETFRLLPTLEGGDPPLNGEDMYEGVYHATSRPGQGDEATAKWRYRCAGLPVQRGKAAAGRNPAASVGTHPHRRSSVRPQYGQPGLGAPVRTRFCGASQRLGPGPAERCDRSSQWHHGATLEWTLADIPQRLVHR